MQSKDQTALENLYMGMVYCKNNHLVRIDEKEEGKLISPDPGWEKLEKDSDQRQGPCICGSNKPFSKCCGVRMEIGDIAYVMTAEECHWLNFSKLKPEYKKQWDKVAGKCGVLVGKRVIPTKDVYESNTESMEVVKGIKRPDGTVYAADENLLDFPTEEQKKQFEIEKKFSTQLPELNGIFFD
jgi:hypothetical protein